MRLIRLSQDFIAGADELAEHGAVLHDPRVVHRRPRPWNHVEEFGQIFMAANFFEEVAVVSIPRPEF